MLAAGNILRAQTARVESWSTQLYPSVLVMAAYGGSVTVLSSTNNPIQIQKDHAAVSRVFSQALYRGFEMFIFTPAGWGR